MYKIIFYKDSKGVSEVEDYINELRRRKDKNNNIKLKKIVVYIDQLSKNGFNLENTYIKHIEGDIWELRPLRDRIFFSYLNNNKFIMLSWFIKRTQKTPRREIERAKRLLKEYKERNGLNE